ncbi:MAG: GxxExxY protein [Gemmatimonadaceae bacterium]
MAKGFLIEERRTHSIIGAFFDVYNTLGFGFLEHVYVLALERELLTRGHRVARELSVRVMYKGEELCTQRLDMVVDDKVVVETKSTFDLHPSAQRQLYSYLRASNLEVGLLLHFGREAKFYRLFCRSTPSPASAARGELERVQLPPPERPDGDVAADPPV